ncbi:MAG: class I SAM-dependent methyltransferase [Candidatus Sericytochromatia bacterium]|nr:class I SAM-dependent methyltransferase [Candidatus Sericytochromatia bacterium]
MLHGVPGTALWGLRARAEESGRSGGLFQDALAQSWYERLAGFSSPELDAWYTPTLQQSIALRTLILDQAVRAHFHHCSAPVLVELGAGFSTRFSRLQPRHGQWYELDIPPLMELRLSLREPPDPRHWVLAYSVLEPDWLAHLKAHDPSQILLLAEGLLMFLSWAEVEALFRRLAEALPGAVIVFDVLGRLNFKAAQAFGEALDAPVHWGAADLSRVCQTLGLEQGEDLSLPAQLRLHPDYGRELRWLQRLILKQRWLTRRMGGTVMGRFPLAASHAKLKIDV